MKKYFAKYLPVEGEPKPGDYVDDPDLKEIVQIVEILEGGVTEGTKVVKLFLCSTDIQVGDKARSIMKLEEDFEISSIEIGSGENHYPAEMIVWNKLDQQTSLWRPLTNVFKVVGPISPQALWVKEGDEFDEDEVAFDMFGENIPFSKADKELFHEFQIYRFPQQYIKIKSSQTQQFH
jgi:hypothetical protein